MVDRAARYARRTRAFAAFTALWWLRPTDALWILYLLHVGWTLWQAGLAEAAFHVVSLLSDLPTGAFADRHGRRASLVAGLAAGAVFTLAIWFVAPRSVGLGVVAVGLSALQWTFVGGADRAVLFGIVADAPAGTGGYAAAYARTMQVGYVAGAAAGIAGGLLAGPAGWLWPFAATAVTRAGAAVCLLWLPPPAAAPDVHRIGIARTLAEAWGVVRARPVLARLTAFGAVFFLFATLNNLFGQATLHAKGASVAGTTALIAAASLLAAGGSWLGGRLGTVRVDRVLAGASAVLATAIALVGALPLGGAAGAFLASDGISGVADPAYEATLNAHTPETVRATVLSAPSTGFSLGMVALFPLTGWLLGVAPAPAVYAGLAAAVLVASLVSLRGLPASISRPVPPGVGAAVRNE